MDYLQSRILKSFLFALIASTAIAVEFDPPMEIYQGMEGFEFGRHTHGAIAVDAESGVHLICQIQDETGKPPDSQILYFQVRNGETSAPVRVDSGAVGGGRHPVMSVGPDGGVHVVWQDYRHTTAAGNYIDNVEIYYDSKPADGSFSDNDIRISHTQAGHLGDSGYMPVSVVQAGGRVAIAWYDFTRNGNNADIYLRMSDESGGFADVTGIEQFRITDAPAASNFASNWSPCLGILSDGSVYALRGYLDGWQGDFSLQGSKIGDDGLPGEIETVGEGGSFLDPPRMAYDTAGNLAVVYPVSEGGLSSIRFQHRSPAGVWSEPLEISLGDNDAEQADVVLDSLGRVHIVWQEDTGGAYQIHYAVVELETMSVLERQTLSDFDFDCRTPSITLQQETERLYTAWIEHNFDIEGLRSLVIRTETMTDVGCWMMH